MLDYSDFTVVKNNEGMPTAMGIPIQSMLLKNNTPLFINGGGGKGNKGKNKDNKNKDNKSKAKSTSKKNDLDNSAHFIEDGEAYDDIHEHLAVPVGLACMTQTVCRKTNDIGIDGNEQMVNYNDNYANYDNMHMGRMNRATEMNESDEMNVIPDDLYERLLKLAEETTTPKKLTRRNKKQATDKKGKTRKNKSYKKK
jgi:hypothetical protein